MYLSTLSPPQPQASHSEFLNISAGREKGERERLPGSDRVEASHNLQALSSSGFSYCCSAADAFIFY